jgi:glutathione synthase/RimK-type ligase-like ATP-grasp enzyme
MSGGILCWGLSGDEPIEAVMGALRARRIAHDFVDQRVLEHLGFDAEAFESIGAAYVRPRFLRQTSREGHITERKLYAWAEMAAAFVVNRPSASASNDSKPYQAERILEHGFAVPPTLTTTTPEIAREFAARHGQVVCKAVGRSRDAVTRLDADDLECLDAIQQCPTQLQAYVPGVDWRVHVIGDEVHACEIRTTVDDYRLAMEQGASLDAKAASLPEAVASRCRVLMRGLGLTLAGIDLRLSTDGEWYCFEVNPSPAFTFFESLTGQPIAAAIADLLIDAARRHPA